MVTFTLQFMCVTSSFLRQLMCVTYINLLLLQNVIKTYASEIYFYSPRRLEHNGAIGYKRFFLAYTHLACGGTRGH